MRELATVPGDVIARFSSRREQVLGHFERLLAEWTTVHGRSPTRAERAGMLDEAAVRSRSAKRKGNETDLHDHWRAQLTAGEQAAIDTVTGCQLAADGGRLPAGSAQLTQAVLVSLHEQRAWWTRVHVFAEVARLVQDPTVDTIELEVERIIGGVWNWNLTRITSTHNWTRQSSPARSSKQPKTGSSLPPWHRHHGTLNHDRPSGLVTTRWKPSTRSAPAAIRSRRSSAQARPRAGRVGGRIVGRLRQTSMQVRWLEPDMVGSEPSGWKAESNLNADAGLVAA